MKNPSVSIGFPVYNSAGIIVDALDSILSQSFEDFELVISDNASTDNTESICREYALKDSRVRYIRQAENIGMIANFKQVLELARGEYFMWHAGDDRKDPVFLELSIRVLRESAEIGLVFCDTEIVDLLSMEKFGDASFGFTTSKIKWFKYLFRLHQGGGPALMYGLHRTELLSQFDLRSFDYFDLHLSHWYELNSQISVIPLKLHVVGSEGRRIAYSLTGERLDPSAYLTAQWRLLTTHFNIAVSAMLFGLAYYRVKRDCRNSMKP